ncbi:hypothetical protein D1007_41983 [Hordeum vulgare]|uniref:Dirigent protein n=1 Tax=Hordeum vulgare subsp. vulgare TaxID=112509 RepID=A0A8I6YPI6_HORVV|nr:uncharacterized protein LOC123410252 [Hordeum vulgare subsp. vulgare]KAE8784431.1 hypothetical protein D1007_41983 [Hordeum vulgare]
MGDHPNFRCTPFDGGVENTEFEFSSLYLHHIYSGPCQTQSNIIGADATTGWGSTEVNNWTIYDGVGPCAKLVARAQGLHLYAGSWHNTFTLRFEIERFKKSTLQVMGASVDEEGEWSIVGGTGELAMARGVITKKLHARTDGGNIIQLTIHGFCRKLMPTLTKLGPWGGDRGFAVDSERPLKIESITILHEGIIGSIEYSYIDQNGNNRTAGPWGSRNPNRAEIGLGHGEMVTEVSGTFGTHSNGEAISTLKIVTNKKTYGPYGRIPGPKPFRAVAPHGKSIVGFFGRTDNIFLNALGVYIA